MVRERGIDASFISSGHRCRENRNDAPTEGDDVRNVDRIDLWDRDSGVACWLTIICPTPRVFGCVAGKGVTAAFCGCVAAKRLSAICREGTENRPKVGG